MIKYLLSILILTAVGGLFSQFTVVATTNDLNEKISPEIAAVFTDSNVSSQTQNQDQTDELKFRRGAVINLGPINPPNIGWGQSAQFNAFVSNANRPIKGVRVEFWFSGQHGIQSAHWTVRTNNEGRATLSKAIPKVWQKQTKWVDLNVSSNDVGAANHWRIKQ